MNYKGSGPTGSHIEISGYGVDELVKSSYPEEIGKQIRMQWHPSAAAKKKPVRVSFWIDQRTGKIVNSRVSVPSGDQEADKAALDAVQNAGTIKVPGTQQGHITSFNVLFPFQN